MPLDGLIWHSDRASRKVNLARLRLYSTPFELTATDTEPDLPAGAVQAMAVEVRNRPRTVLLTPKRHPSSAECWK
jgi:hypothetical protein